MEIRRIGQYIVLDPAVCLGAPTFRGTHITVADVLDRVADNDKWDAIVEHHEGAITIEAIAEAVRLAGNVFTEHARVPAKDEMDAPPTVLGEHIVADPAICHGTVTFRGTRLFVADVYGRVANRMDWDAIIADFHGSITRDAIAEAVRLASDAFAGHARDSVVDSAYA
ncbi:MAG: DUF433 domain-containing protein [Dehalococcoidia bacterium]